jgi:hypothetical protein
MAFTFCYILSFSIFIIQTKKKEIDINPHGPLLAKHFCGSCHDFPHPFEYSQDYWQSEILPTKRKLLLNSSGIEEEIGIDLETWKNIERFYLKNAPDTLTFSILEGTELSFHHLMHL